jgi:hypothetical protein
MLPGSPHRRFLKAADCLFSPVFRPSGQASSVAPQSAFHPPSCLPTPINFPVPATSAAPQHPRSILDQ